MRRPRIQGPVRGEVCQERKHVPSAMIKCVRGLWTSHSPWDSVLPSRQRPLVGTSGCVRSRWCRILGRVGILQCQWLARVSRAHINADLRASADGCRDSRCRAQRRLRARFHHGPLSHQVMAMAATGQLGMAAGGQIRLAVMREVPGRGRVAVKGCGMSGRVLGRGTGVRQVLAGHGK